MISIKSANRFAPILTVGLSYPIFTGLLNCSVNCSSETPGICSSNLCVWPFWVVLVISVLFALIIYTAVNVRSRRDERRAAMILFFAVQTLVFDYIWQAIILFGERIYGYQYLTCNCGSGAVVTAIVLQTSLSLGLITSFVVTRVIFGKGRVLKE